MPWSPDAHSKMLDFIEQFWLQKARSAIRVSAETPTEEVLEKIRPCVAELSDLFTVARPEKFRDYMSDARLLAAYGLFFFPQSFARADFAARRLLGFYGRSPKNADKTLSILDLGSGASPCGLALAGALQERFPQANIELTAVDRSRAALDAVPLPGKTRIKLKTECADLRNFAGTQHAFDFIVLGWSLNEIIPATTPDAVEKALVFLKKLANSLKPTGTLLILEPALKETTERLQRVSDYFARTPGLPFHRLAPELGNHEDPLLAEGGISWNHEVRRWTAPASLEFINRKLFREIQVLKFSWCALGKTPSALAVESDKMPALLRLISPMEMTKTALRFSAVDAVGAKKNVEIPVRGLSKSECKKMAAAWERGDIASVAGELTPLGTPSCFRLAGTLEKIL